MTAHPVSTATGVVFVEPGRVDATHALVVGRVTDEVSPVSPGPLRVTATARRSAEPAPGHATPAFVTAASGGWWAVAGRAGECFPTLALEDHVVRVELAVDGFVPAVAEVVVAMGTTTFPVTGAAVALRRPAVRLRGRVLMAGSFPPVPAPGVHDVAIVAPAGLVGFERPVAAAHPIGAEVQVVTLAPIAGPLVLGRDASPGTAAVHLPDRTGIVPGSAVELAGPQHREVAVVEGIEGPADPSRAGRVRLTTPLRHHHPVAATVVTVHDVVDLGAGTTLTDSLSAGERVTFVADATLLPDGQVCRLGSAASADEELGVVAAAAGTTDADGFYVTGPVGRTVEVRVAVTPGGGPPTRHPLSYDQPDNVVDLEV